MNLGNLNTQDFKSNLDVIIGILKEKDIKEFSFVKTNDATSIVILTYGISQRQYLGAVGLMVQTLDDSIDFEIVDKIYHQDRFNDIIKNAEVKNYVL